MAIEFRCPNCDKKLKTGDDKAGKTAKCPQCGTPVTVPAASAVETEDEFGDFGDFPPLEDPVAGPLPARKRRASGGGQVACPMCGAMNDSAAVRCYACGEDLFAAASQEGGTRPANFDVGDQLSKGYEIFKAEMGACIVVALLYLMIPGGINQALGFGLQLVAGGMNQGGGGGDAALGVFLVGQFAVMVIQFLVQVFFDAGCTLFVLNLIRRRPAQIGDLFAGGPYFLSLALNRFVFFLLQMVPYLPGGLVLGIGAAIGGDAGTIVMIVGGVLLAVGAAAAIYLFVVLWPHTWLIVDKNPPGLAALKASPALTAGFRGQITVMGLLYWLLMMAGFLACCFGILFTLPIANLMAGIGYDRLVRARGVTLPR